MINKQKEGGFYASKAKLKELVVDMPDDKQEPNKDELSRVTLVTPKSAKVLPLIFSVQTMSHCASVIVDSFLLKAFARPLDACQSKNGSKVTAYE